MLEKQPKLSDVVKGLQMIFFGLLHPFLEENERLAEDYGDPTEIRNVLTRNGWSPRETISVIPMTPDEQKRAVADRLKEYEATKIKAEKDQNAFRLLNVYKQIWFVGGDEKKPLLPLYKNNMGFRRTTNYAQAMADRQLLAVADRLDPRDYIWDIPVDVKQYESPLDAKIDQLKENGADKEGSRDMSFNGWVKSCLPLVEAGFYEKKLEAILKRGSAQKVHGVCKVHLLCREAELIPRGFLDPKDPNYVPLQSIPAAATRELLKDNKRPTREEVEAMITKVKGGQVNQPKIAERKVIEGLQQNNPNALVRLVAEKIIANKTEHLPAVLTPIAPHCDILLSIATGNPKVLPELLHYLKQFDASKVVLPKVEDAETVKA